MPQPRPRVPYGPIQEEDLSPSAAVYHHPRDALRRVQRVSTHAAWQIWADSDDLAAQTAFAAVDQWEALYLFFRGVVIAGAGSAQNLYLAAKEGSSRIEDGLGRPVSQFILVPAFSAVEHSLQFVQSPEAHQVVEDTLQQVPILGDNVLVPSYKFTIGFFTRTWEILQYPIPSKTTVKHTVQACFNTTKWALGTAGREVFLYAKRADANITRTLSTTQWKVLGSGPYVTLSPHNQQEIMNHWCERYLATPDAWARYELAAHLQRHNPALYMDLVVSGILQQRGAQEDEWLNTVPVYRHMEEPFLLEEDDVQPSALWFRWPRFNGQRQTKDVPWICLRYSEQKALEAKYRQVLREGVRADDALDETLLQSNASPFPTVAQWYEPTSDDLLLDQKRHAVTFLPCCANCRHEMPPIQPPLAPQEDSLCETCRELPPCWFPAPWHAVWRPTLWRFYGPGDDVRRATWLLDTPRHGLQPFDEAAQAILEDAYWFLQWMVLRQQHQEAKQEGLEDHALLTIEVSCPDGAERLVQFSSLTHATAIQKGLFPAMTLFKRRVYRGAWLLEEQQQQNLNDESQDQIVVETSILRAVQENGALGETVVPDIALRQVLTPPEDRHLVLYQNQDDLAVPPARLGESDMSKFLKDLLDADVDNLVLVVHGIGEMLRSTDLFGILPNIRTIIDCCGFLRKNFAEVQNADVEQVFPPSEEGPVSSGRTDFIPVEWHESFSIMSQRRATGADDRNRANVMIKDISLRTIPNMRNFANETLMDVLYFMSREHHDIIVSLVANEMNVVVEKFARLTGFSGRVSIMGHSLGSIISWDILEHQKSVPVEAAVGLQPVLSMESMGSLSDLESAPELTVPDSEAVSPKFPQLDFTVDNFFLLGSPVAVFLMIRNQRKPLPEDFVLNGCRRVFNIFHPYDPIAYRIEPCINARNANYEPSIMKHWNGGFRVQYQTKRLWRKLLQTTWKTQQSVVEAFEKSMAGMGLFEADDYMNDEDTSASDRSGIGNRVGHVSTGSLNQGRRIDFMLQEKEIETANEYVAALAAHGSYWVEKDLSLFVARQLQLSSMEESPEEASVLSWQSMPPSR